MHPTVTNDEILRIVYDAYCDYSRELSIVSTHHTILKICEDSGLHCKMFDKNRVELALRRHLAKGQQEMDYANFIKFIETEMAAPYMIARKLDHASAVAEIKKKIRDSWPSFTTWPINYGPKWPPKLVKHGNVITTDKIAATYHVSEA